MTAPVSWTSLPVGFVINRRYEVLGTLGRGATSAVYEVRDHNQHEVSALKLILGNISPTAVWDEARILTGLRGEYILPVRNADLASGVPFIVTEVAPRTVHGAIQPSIGADIDGAVRWTRQACRGVARIHDVGLLHTDIKPENLFLDQNDDVLVGDLGYASLQDANGNGHFAGTAETMAPEVATVGATIPSSDWHLHRPTAVASDVYSLGATLYWMLAGQPPYLVPGDPVATMRQVTAGPPVALRDLAPQVPQGLAERVERAMSPNVADRFGNAAAFDAALGNLPTARRRWNRVPPHAGHAQCFLGTGHGSNLHICAVPTGRRAEHQIQVTHANSGRRVNPWSKVPTPRTLPRALRTAFRDHA